MGLTEHHWGVGSVLAGDSDAAHLARAAAGEQAAFARIVAAHHADMRRVSYVICGDLDLVDDSLQQAWSVAWRKLGTVRDPARLRPWLVAVAANETRQLMRRQRRRPEVELDAAVVDPSAFDTGVSADHLDLATALRRLRPDERALLALRYVAGLNATEIARNSGGTPGGIRSRLARLLAHLREELSDG